MAKKRTSGKITRRAAVTMLGGAAALRGRRADASAAPVHEQPTKPECKDPARVFDFEFTYGGQRRLAMFADTCCGESRMALLHGVDTPGRNPTPNTKSHLQALTKRIMTDDLDEYCFMIWGLGKDQVESLRTMVPERLALKQRIDKK